MKSFRTRSGSTRISMWKVLEYLAESELVYEDTVIIVEASKNTDFTYLDDLGFHLLREKEYKTNKHVFIEKAGKEEVC